MVRWRARPAPLEHEHHTEPEEIRLVEQGLGNLRPMVVTSSSAASSPARAAAASGGTVRASSQIVKVRSMTAAMTASLFAKAGSELTFAGLVDLVHRRAAGADAGALL
jgi:hypothetical protein